MIHFPTAESLPASLLSILDQRLQQTMAPPVSSISLRDAGVDGVGFLLRTRSLMTCPQ